MREFEEVFKILNFGVLGIGRTILSKKIWGGKK